MTLRERVAATLEDFKAQCWRDDWDVTIVEQVIAPASRTPGLAVFTTVRDGITFQTPVLPDDDLAAFFGVQALHLH